MTPSEAATRAAVRLTGLRMRRAPKSESAEAEREWREALHAIPLRRPGAALQPPVPRVRPEGPGVRDMIRLALTLAAALASACAVIEETPEEVRVRLDPGGSIAATQDRYRSHYTGEDERRVVVDGTVASAAAMLAMGAPGACYTDRAVWQPHGAISLTPGMSDRELTEVMATALPAPLRRWFLDHHPSHLTFGGLATVDAEGLRALWPAGYCGEGA